MNSRPRIPLLGAELRFPDPRKARADGLVAMGGDLEIPRLLLAYRSGIFPWSVSPITWWSPDPRGVIEFGNFHLSDRVRRKMKTGRYRFSLDEAFPEVIAGCADPAPGREDTWIDPELEEAYILLHQAGHAHSVECWEGEELVGGVYGVAQGAFFAGESMFSRVSDGSKMALAHLLEHLKARGFALFDTQMVTPHTKGLGATEMPREEYLKRLGDALSQTCSF